MTCSKGRPGGDDGLLGGPGQDRLSGGAGDDALGPADREVDARRRRRGLRHASAYGYRSAGVRVDLATRRRRRRRRPDEHRERGRQRRRRHAARRRRPERLDGRDGRDRLDGRGGDDVLIGARRPLNGGTRRTTRSSAQRRAPTCAAAPAATASSSASRPSRACARLRAASTAPVRSCGSRQAPEDQLRLEHRASRAGARGRGSRVSAEPERADTLLLAAARRRSGSRREATARGSRPDEFGALRFRLVS